MKKLACVVLLLVWMFFIMIPVSANSAEPPGLIILSNNLPEEAMLTLETPRGETAELRQSRRSDFAWESQYRLWFSMDYEAWHEAVLRVTVGQTSFTCPLPEGTVNRYNTVLTLDYEARTLSLGQSVWRQPVLTAIRIVLTLLAEALVFFLFGFREKRTWLLFLALNLLTQGWLNCIINSNAFTGGYWMIVYYLAEIVIFVGEAVAAALLMKEHKAWKRVVCALLANAASLAAGVALISNLPI